MSHRPPLRLGTAGWTIPKAVADAFPGHGTGLQRYGARFHATEINSSFHRRHRRSTYERWVGDAPTDFQFAFKISKFVTHEARLQVEAAALAPVLEDALLLGDKLGPLLIQLPPSLSFDLDIADRFFGRLRDAFDGRAACEPRHSSWFEPPADRLLAHHRVARVAADPARHPLAGEPGGWRGFSYWRWHGSPRVYYSAYDDDRLQALSARLQLRTTETWCIFDNTASGAAASDALRLQLLLEGAHLATSTREST